MEKEIKFKGYKTKARVFGNGSSLYLEAKEANKILRKILKEAGIKAKVRKKSGRSIRVVLPREATEEELQKAEKLSSGFSGASFDGMQDLKENIARQSDEGERILLETDFVFVGRERS